MKKKHSIKKQSIVTNAKPTDIKSNSLRVRRFSLTSYIDEKNIERYLRQCEWIQHWAYITHDKDITDEGIAKEKHIHILLYTYNAKTSSGVRKNFERYAYELAKQTKTEPQNTLCDIMHDSVSCWRYLIHKDNPEKFQYKLEDITCDSYSYWSSLEQTDGLNCADENTGLQMFNDLMSGISTYEMIERYGKEYIYHSHHFKSVIADTYREQYRPTFEGFRDMCMFALADGNFNENEIKMFMVMIEYVQNKFKNEQGCEFVIEQLKG